MSNFIYRFFRQVRSNIITGVLLIIPLFVTALIIIQLFQWIDKALPGIFKIDLPPGIGVLITLVVAYFAGIAAKNYFGKKFIAVGDGIISSIPFLNKIYLTIQQVVNMVSNNKKQVFERAVLVEFPRPQCYCIAFVTSRANTVFSMNVTQKLVSVFVPQTPPVSGVVLYVPESDIIEVPISVEAALKLVVSGGLLGADNAMSGQTGVDAKKTWKWSDFFSRKPKSGEIFDPRD